MRLPPFFIFPFSFLFSCFPYRLYAAHRIPAPFFRLFSTNFFICGFRDMPTPPYDVKIHFSCVERCLMRHRAYFFREKFPISRLSQAIFLIQQKLFLTFGKFTSAIILAIQPVFLRKLGRTIIPALFLKIGVEIIHLVPTPQRFTNFV